MTSAGDPKKPSLGTWLILAMAAIIAFGGYIAFPKGATCRGHRPSSHQAPSAGASVAAVGA